jgi:exosortase/archaeosortase family protein
MIPLFQKPHIQYIKTRIQQIPSPVKTFLWRAFVVFVIWEMTYSIYLLPDRIIDRPLTMFVGNSTANFINLIKQANFATCQYVSKTTTIEGNTISTMAATVFLGPKRLIGIADGCNGLSLFVLFIGFILAYPGNVYLKLGYAFIGTVIITFLNISRCTGLALVHNSYPNLTDFAHHYLFKIITYTAIFYMWLGFIKINQKINTKYA